MSWLRLEDTITMHPKVVAAGNAAVGAWVRLLAYSAMHLTDGIIPRAVARQISSGRELATLLKVGLLHESGADYELHDYLDWNPPASEVRAARQARSEAGARGGKASGLTRRSKQNGTNGEASASRLLQAKPNPIPSHTHPKESPAQDLQVLPRAGSPAALVLNPESGVIAPLGRADVFENSQDSERAARLRREALAKLEALKTDPSFATGGSR